MPLKSGKIGKMLRNIPIGTFSILLILILR